MRILEYRIGENEDCRNVESFLRERLHFSKKQISRLKFREGGMTLNGVQCRSTDALKKGDHLQILLDEIGKRRSEPENYEASIGIEEPSLLYEDEDLLAVCKPGGMAAHPSHGHYRDSLWNWILSYQEIKGENWTPRLIGRLDKDTSGIVLLAKSTEAAAELAAQREKKLLRKTYLALAEGSFPETEGVIDAPIEKDDRFLNRMKTGPDGLPARTFYSVLRETDRGSLLKVELEHGRTHQIRLHLSSIGHPLAGDPVYNEGRKENEELHLHAWQLEFNRPFTGEQLIIEAPLPDWCEGGNIR